MCRIRLSVMIRAADSSSSWRSQVMTVAVMIDDTGAARTASPDQWS